MILAKSFRFFGVRSLWALVLFFLCFSGLHAEIPQVLHYQGMLLSRPATSGSTSELPRPVYGRIEKQLTVNIRPFLGGGILDTPVYTTTFNDVLIDNGVFDLEIPVPATLSFNQSYAVEVVVLSAGGGSAGVVPLRAVPYAFMAKTASTFGGFPASAFARKGHGHNSATRSFTLDATGQTPQPGVDRFRVINGSEASVPGFAVFTVDANGSITRVSLMSFSGAIIAEGALRVLDANGRTLVSEVRADGSALFRNVVFKGASTAKTMVVSGATQMDTIKIGGSLIFGPDSAIAARPGGQDTPNIIGLTHRLEDHTDSLVLQGLQSITSGAIVTAGLHRHVVQDGIFGPKALSGSIVTSSTVLDGSIKNEDLATDAAIPDTALAPINTPGKIAATALPSELARKDQSNTFGAGFATGQGGLIQTLNQLDRVRSKTVTIVATSSLASLVLFEARSFGGEFRWVLENNGTLTFRRQIGGTAEETRLKIQPMGSRATMEFSKFRFEGDPNMVNGTSIADGSITGDRIIASSIPGDRLVDGAISTTVFADGTIPGTKIATSAITSDRIADGAIGNAQIQDGAITLTKMANEVLTEDKFQAGSLTLDRIEASALRAVKFEAGSLGPEHIVSGTLTEDYLADSSIPGTVIQTLAIGNLNLADEVLTLRDKPVSIEMDNPTTPIMFLKAETSGQRPLDMFSNQGTTGSFEDIKGIELASADGSRSIGFSVNGKLSVRSTNFTTVVTLEPDMLSTAFGAPRFGANSCVQTDFTLVSDSSNTTGTGFCFKELLTPNNYESAMADCFSAGASLCTLPETLMACRRGVYTVTNTMMTAELVDTVGDGTMHYVTLQVPSGACTSAGNITLGNILASTNNPAYGCCYRP